MEDILNVITSRRSIRSFKQQTPSKELIKKVITAGVYAPTGKNLQAPIILAVTNKKVRDELSKLLAKERGIETDPFYGAPVLLIVLAKKDVSTYLYDGSCVLENMLLEAHSLGLGACWIHHAKAIFETNQGKQILNNLNINPEEYEGVGTCILGYAKNFPLAPIKRKENYVYYVE
ncbi:MAG: nitroreductase family protein [Clostridiales bacterium]|nr:nitroreductase family protein [Clostridiales bacterium]